MRSKIILVAPFLLFAIQSFAQVVKGLVVSDSQHIPGAKVMLVNNKKTVYTDHEGRFNIQIDDITQKLLVEAEGYKIYEQFIKASPLDTLYLNIELHKSDQNVDEVVITGTMKEVKRLDSPVPVEIYSPAFFKKNPTPNVFEALGQINGVRPQVNCSVCNTGDIHINGLEGPYTMILIDGMPVVSALSTVYGLSGIPNSLIDRIEVVKGPASSLYGSEAIGGLINIITKRPAGKSYFTAESMVAGDGAYNFDLGWNASFGKGLNVLTGLNHFLYNHPVDKNADNFTDVTLQNRWSVFQKWMFPRKRNKILSIAARYNYEDRWGGEMQWKRLYRGGEEVYGESIYTNRYELIGNYELPVVPKMLLSVSFNNHNQNSVYGSTIYQAKQKVAFSQLTLDQSSAKNEFLTGLALRYSYYDDNSPATATADGLSNKVEHTFLPGIFVQNEWKWTERNSLLLGMRYDYNSNHGHIFTPRIAFRRTVGNQGVLRFNAGTGYRVVNLFTEDHAALNGSRDVEIVSNLKPERSYNANLNYFKKYNLQSGSLIQVDATAFYTHFTNRIVGDFESDATKIRYNNLNGYAVSGGISLNVDGVFVNGWKLSVGTTLMDIYLKDENQIKTLPVFTERWTGTWNISYKPIHWNLGIDYTGNIYGRMRMPLISNLDPRSEYAPVWSIQNIQATYFVGKKWELFGGVKNFLNFTPGKAQPFLIARSNDPFDKNVQFNSNNQVVATPDNPYALTFDPGYIYAPNQGVRLFFGFRMKL